MSMLIQSRPCPSCGKPSAEVGNVPCGTCRDRAPLLAGDEHLTYGPLSWDCPESDNPDDVRSLTYFGYYRHSRIYGWNGFSCPLFPKAEADRLAAYNAAVRAISPEACEEIVYLPEQDAYQQRHVEMWGDDGCPTLAEVALVCSGESEATNDDVPVYPIGAASWTWSPSDRGTAAASHPESYTTQHGPFTITTLPDPRGYFLAYVTDTQDDGVNFLSWTDPIYDSHEHARGQAIAELDDLIPDDERAVPCHVCDTAPCACKEVLATQS